MFHRSSFLQKRLGLKRVAARERMVCIDKKTRVSVVVEKIYWIFCLDENAQKKQQHRGETTNEGCRKC